LNKLQPKIGTH